MWWREKGLLPYLIEFEEQAGFVAHALHISFGGVVVARGV